MNKKLVLRSLRFGNQPGARLLKNITKGAGKNLMKAMILPLIAAFLCGCGGTGGAPSEKTSITFADVGWDSIKLNNAIAGLIAERVFGYTWKETPGSTPISHEALVKGEIDINMEEWTDNIPSYVSDLEAGRLKEVGMNFNDNHQGIYIPRYVYDANPGLRTVRDLKNYADLFKDPDDPSRSIIYGGVVGWEVTKIMENKVKLYGLDEYYDYVESGSDAILSASMVSAWDKQLPIAAYYWEPTWLLGKYDFVLLEDDPYDPERYIEGYGACPSVSVTIAVNNAFYETNPTFCAFLAKYSMPSAVINECLAHMNDTGEDYSETALWLLTESHPELVSEWLDTNQAAAFHAGQ